MKGALDDKIRKEGVMKKYDLEFMFKDKTY